MPIKDQIISSQFPVVMDHDDMSKSNEDRIDIEETPIMVLVYYIIDNDLVRTSMIIISILSGLATYMTLLYFYEFMKYWWGQAGI